MKDSAANPVEDGGVYVIDAGAQTAVGKNFRGAAAAVRCGISAYAELPFMIDRKGEPMVVARADWLDECLPAFDRVKRLGADAAAGAISITLPGDARVGFHIAVSSELFPEQDAQQVAALAIQARLHRFSAATARIFADGHAAGTQALQSAVDDIRAGQADVCLVGGVDSWLDADRLERIDRAGRLHSLHNSWGFTPGEGAAFLLLASGAFVREFRLAAMAEVCAVATAHEPHVLGGETVCIGEGLTSAFRGALSGCDKVADSYCDLNGETYRADEFGFAVCRTSEFFDDAGRFTAAAECWGDVGAASVPLGVTLALAAWVGGYASGDQALVWSSSASAPERGAVRLRSKLTRGN